MELKKMVAALAMAGVAGSVFATNGYFAHGVGVKAKAMGGAGIAFAEDGFGIGANPATLSQAGSGLTLGASIFTPDRDVSLRGKSNGAGADIAGGNGWSSGNQKDVFVIPEVAYVRHGNDAWSYGVAVYGNGGMNVDYGKAMYDTSGDKTFANLEQLFIAPTVSKKLNETHTVAVSLNLVYQTFNAGGLDMFTCYTPGGNCGTGAGAADPGNKGKDTSTGVGIRLGWTGEMSKSFSMGAFYQPETRMSKFGKYNYLLAEHGKFNIPETYGVGMAFTATPTTKVLADIVQINYNKIRALGNKNNHTPGTTNLGEDDGKGFGWRNMTVFKFGIRHDLDAATVLRAGWNYAKQPIPTGELDFNLLAPAVVEHHFTVGATRKIDSDKELSLHYMYAPSKLVSGTFVTGTGTNHVDKMRMNQMEVGAQFSWKF